MSYIRKSEDLTVLVDKVFEELGRLADPTVKITHDSVVLEFTRMSRSFDLDELQRVDSILDESSYDFFEHEMKPTNRRKIRIRFKADRDSLVGEEDE